MPSIEYYIKPLTRQVNSTFENGTFPDELKMVKVIPIFKSGNKADITYYRPISMVPFFTKFFEKMMHTYLINLIDKHNIL